MRADVLTTTTQSIQMPQQGMQMQQQKQQHPQQMSQQQQFVPRGMIQKQWRGQAPVVSSPNVQTGADLVRSVPVYNANLQAAPPLPPENILTDSDKQVQINYESWLNQQNDSLQQQVRYYETEIGELRKMKKSLNTKQRQLKKNGSDLTDIDAQTLMKVSQEQAVVQKHLENSRKLARNHTNVKQDYENKQKAKQMVNIPHMVPSPASQMNDQSPMMSPSPNIMQQSVNSPHGSQIMAPSQSPLHSPSPMMSAPSPGPNSIMQSPGGHMSNAMSPYNTMQQSPRIGTPHSQIDESPFSPNSGPIDSPSISGRLTSPIPRMTSPQHRPNTPHMQIQMMNRMGPGQQPQFPQQQNMNQQNRFIRPQMIPNDSNSRMTMRMPVQFQQQVQQQQVQQQQQQQKNHNIIRQTQYDANGNPQNIIQQQQQQQNSNQAVNQQMDQSRALQIRQFAIARQHQLLQQQQQQQQMQQGGQGQIQQSNQGQMVQMQHIQHQQHMVMQNQQQNMQNIQNAPPNQSPIHQPQSPLINQNVQSPMIQHYQQQQQQHQNPNSPMTMGIDSSPRPVYMQQQSMMDHSSNQQQQHMQMQGSGGGGMSHDNNPVPAPSDVCFKSVKLGLKGGSPMWGNGGNSGNNSGNGGNKKQSNTAEMLALIKKAQQQAEMQKNNIPGKVIPGSIASACSSSGEQATTSKQQQKPKASLLRNPLAAKAKSLVDYDDDDSSNGTTTMYPNYQKAKKMLEQEGKSDDVVIVDSSPDEKQKIVDYDDDNDKMVVTEVSLNSTAQDLTDNDTIIETSFDRSELVSSPLVTEPVATDYALFESHVVLDDSNESLKEILNTEVLFEEPNANVETKPISSSSSMDSSKGDDVIYVVDKVMSPKSNIGGTREDFEAMIDSGKDDDENESESEVIAIEKCDQTDTDISEKAIDIAQKTRIITAASATPSSPIPEKREIKIPVVFSSSGNTMLSLPSIPKLVNRANISMSNFTSATHKKLVGNQTTAKVNIGNTTISVPVVLKNMPISTTTDTQSGTKKILTTNAIISNLKKNTNPTLINVSGQKILISNTLNKGNTRPIQTVDLKQRIQHHQKSDQHPISVTTVTCITSSSPTTSSTFEMSHGAIVSKISSTGTPILTFSKIPQLTMTQDASLPTKILEDDDMSESVDDKDQNKSSEPMEGVQEENGKEISDPTGGTQKSLIPVHVIIKSRESSQSPSATMSTTSQQQQTQRLTSSLTGISSNIGNMSQLSPLSQPIEINTNTHNATQQIRSIMSSLDSNEDSKNKTATITSSENNNQFVSVSSSSSSSSSATSGIQKTIFRSTSTPAGDTKIIISSSPAISTSSNIQTITSQQQQQQPSNNVLFVKQIKTIPSTSSGIISNSAPSPSTTSTIVVVSQAGQVQSQGSSSVITLNKHSNRLIDYLNSQQGNNSNKLESKMDPPDAQGIPKTAVTILKSNPTITNLLNANSFKRSKSSDDVASTAKEGNSEISAILSKRLSLEVSNEIKTEPLESPIIKESESIPVTTSTAIKIEPSTPPILTQPKPPPYKPEDSQNVLLKQLLQNSGSGNPVGPIARTSINPAQRAPALGVFSSLEAQLATPPVIPPAPAKPIIVTSQPSVSMIPSVISTQQQAISPDNNSTKTTPSKTIHETSFVSQQPTPSPIATPSSTSINIVTSSAVISSINEKKPIVVLNRNDIPANILNQQLQQQQLSNIVSKSFC